MYRCVFRRNDYLSLRIGYTWVHSIPKNIYHIQKGNVWKYSGWKKSCTTKRMVETCWNPINWCRINHLSTGDFATIHSMILRGTRSSVRPPCLAGAVVRRSPPWGDPMHHVPSNNTFFNIQKTYELIWKYNMKLRPNETQNTSKIHQYPRKSNHIIKYNIIQYPISIQQPQWAPLKYQYHTGGSHGMPSPIATSRPLLERCWNMLTVKHIWNQQLEVCVCVWFILNQDCLLQSCSNCA